MSRNARIDAAIDLIVAMQGHHEKLRAEVADLLKIDTEAAERAPDGHIDTPEGHKAYMARHALYVVSEAISDIDLPLIELSLSKAKL